MESKGTTVVASCIHQALTDSHRYTTLTDATTTYKITLRDGIKFSDGSDITATDFVDTWNFVVENGLLNTSFFSPIKGYEEGVETLEGLNVVDDRTFTIELAQPDSEFTQRIGYYGFAPMPASARDDIDAFGENPVSSGPYKLEQWDHNAELKVVANEHYDGPRAANNDGLKGAVATWGGSQEGSVFIV